jgi:hypothetical protein
MVGEWGRGQRTRRVVILSEAKEPKSSFVMIHHEGTEATKGSLAGSHRFIPRRAGFRPSFFGGLLSRLLAPPKKPVDAGQTRNETALGMPTESSVPFVPSW